MIGGIDLGFIVIYFVVVAIIGYRASKQNKDNARSYFLADNNIGWLAIGASLFASNISAEHCIGLAGSGAQGGLAVGQFEWLASFILILLGWLFVPYYLKTKVYTMPEFLEKRYNKASRMYLSYISLVAYVFTKVSVALYAGALVLNTILGWNIWFGAIALVVLTGIYTITGGLRAVIWTDFFQAFVLIGGALALTIISIYKVGGFEGLLANTPTEYFNLWKPISNPDFPWTGILFGAPILGIWYWCTDQMIVQRTLSAKDITSARKATVFAGFLKILPVFIMVLPGIAGHILFPTTPANKIYATMVNTLLPVGVKGLVIAALLAALMSSLSSVFNSSSTIIVMDIYKKIRAKASQKELVVMGKLFTVFLVVVGILWIPFIGYMSDQLYIYLQSVQAYIAPPIAAVFLLGIISKRVNGFGSIVTLLTGFFIGGTRFILEILTKKSLISLSGYWQWFVKMNFLHFALFLFIISILVLYVASLVKAPVTTKEQNLNFPEGVLRSNPYSRGLTVASILLSLSVLACWIYFSPLFF